MAEREQIKKQAPARTEEADEAAPATTDKGEKLKAELDDLLDALPLRDWTRSPPDTAPGRSQ